MEEYTVTGPAGEYTVQLSDEEAKARGLKPNAPRAKAKTPANKQAAPQNKAASSAQKADG